MSHDLIKPDRLPPHSRQAEAGVIGSVIRDNRVYDDLSLSHEAFYIDAHQKLWRAIADLFATRKPVDLLTLHEILKSRKQLEDVGGVAYLAELWDAAPTAANAEYYAGIVQEAWTRRRLIHLATEISRDAFDGTEPAAELVSRLEFQVGQLVIDPRGSSLVQLHEAVSAGIEEMRRLGDPKHQPLRTGLSNVDELVSGLWPGSLIVIAARPSVGKSALGLTMALQWCMPMGKSVAIFSMEMSYQQLGIRSVANLTRINAHKMREGRLSPSEWDLIDRARDDIAANAPPLWIDDTPSRTVRQIASICRRLKAKHNLGVVLIDYLQLVEGDDRRATRREQVGQISRGLKRLARELEVPIVALAQLNRDPENRPDGRPIMADLKESGDIEQDADDVYLMWRPKDQDEDAKSWTVGLEVVKQRNGPTGVVMLDYVRSSMVFESPRKGGEF